jgi:hypothetical protein
MATGFYLGPPGAPVAIPDPDPGLAYPLIRKGGTHELLSGGTVRDLIGLRRRFELSWQLLTQDELSPLEELFALPGPLVLIDLTRRNHLTAQQAAGTGYLNSTSGFVVATGTLTSDTAHAGTTLGAGRRSLKWAAGALGSTGNGPATGTSTTAASLFNDMAVIPSEPYSVGMRAQRSSAGTITMGARVEWYTSAGVFISGSTGTGTALGTSSWDLLKIENQTAPATAAYLKVRCVNTATTGGARDVFMDAWQAEQATTLSAWVLGTGTPVVAPDSLEAAYPHLPWTQASLVLVEL